MINSDEKKAIIAVLGRHASRKIIPYLNSIKCFNIKGKSFSPKSIQDVLNGITENKEAELNILKLVAIEKVKTQELEAFKKETL